MVALWNRADHYIFIWIVMKQEMMGWQAPAGPYADYLHLAPDR